MEGLCLWFVLVKPIFSKGNGSLITVEGYKAALDLIISTDINSFHNQGIQNNSYPVQAHNGEVNIAQK